MDEQLLNIGIKIKGLQSATFSGRINSVPYERRLEQNESSLVYLEAITSVLDMIIEARNKQDSEGLKKMAKCMQDIVFYVNQLELDRNELLHKVIYKE